MNAIVVDDERLILMSETETVKRVLKGAEINSFRKAVEAVDYASKNKVDIAFLDINMEVISGIELAKKLQKINPNINIIFCTGYSEYSLDALGLYCSAYLMKPVTEAKIKEALKRLRYPIEESKKLAKVHCFGNFEIYKDDQPIKFKNSKTKELLAYLVDRNGATVSSNEIMCTLFEEDNKESYVRNLRSDLMTTLTNLGIGEIIIHNGSNIGVNPELLDCDYYDYLNGNKKLFHGEYMSQYSFADFTLGNLEDERY